MGSSNDNIVDVYEFESRLEYRHALKEYEIICNLEKKMTLGDPKTALSLYNQAISKRTFKTPVGYAFLKRLRDTVITCGMADDATLNKVLVVSGSSLSKGSRSRGTRGDSDAKEDNTASAGSGRAGGYKIMYEKEKKTKTILSVAVFALMAVIIGMFVVTLNSKYSFITYFTDYENNIRNEIINEYEQWEEELKAREQALGN